jgi:two-component system chemotaxis response regulator CheY
MAILIVDDETNTRAALRHLLESFAGQPILEARDGEEGLRMLKASPARIDMIVADWEMPNLDGLELVREIGTVRELDLAPFLLITSDLPEGAIEEFRATNPRLDHYLIKPFRAKALAAAMADAARSRAQARGTLLYVGDRLPEGLAAVLEKRDDKHKARSHWNSCVCVGTATEAAARLGELGASVGALLVSAEACSRLDPSWLSSFKKTPLGTATPVVLLSRDPQGLRPLRTLAQLCVDLGRGDVEHWRGLLSGLSRSLQGAWALERATVALKALAQKGEHKAARKLFTDLFSHDELAAESHLVAGEVCEGLKDVEDACRHYRRALELNPCLPRPYLRLLTLEAERARLAETAVQFCPGNVEVLLAAARAWLEEKQYDRAAEALAQLLVVAPGHEGARQLLAGLRGGG